MELSAVTFATPLEQTGPGPQREATPSTTAQEVEAPTQNGPTETGAPQSLPEQQVSGAQSVAATGETEKAAAVEKRGELSGEFRQLTPEEKQRVAELKSIDTEVRAHERAHLAAAGSLARGGASFDYVTGPDGQRYAVSGEVSIDTSGVSGDAEATIAKAQNIRRAALAPAQPSAQDQRVAASANRLEFEARSALAAEHAEEVRERSEPKETPASPIATQLPPNNNPINLFI